MLKEGVYRHYKGNLYRLICIARHSETLEETIVYQDVLHPEKIWARPAKMWCESVLSDGREIPRFEYVASSVEELNLPR